MFGDSEYNLSDFDRNKNYINNREEIKLKEMYRTSSEFTNNQKKFHFPDGYQQAMAKKNNNNNKHVKINDNINIIPVESYKEYNKIEETELYGTNCQNLMNNYYNSRNDYIQNNNKESGECCGGCLIL